MLEVGPQGMIPANLPPLPQHAVLAVLNPENFQTWHRDFIRNFFLSEPIEMELQQYLPQYIGKIKWKIQQQFVQ